MIMKQFISLCLLLICSVIAFAQTAEDQKKIINNVKKNDSYIYAETTLADKQEAISLAKELLYQRINEYIAKQKEFRSAKETVVVNQNYVTEEIQLPRANMFRAFVYVKKSDILAVDNATVGSITKEVDTSGSLQEATAHFSAPNVIDELLTLKTLSQLQERLPQLKKEGKIANFASYNKLSNPEEYIIIIYSQEGEVKAVLSEGRNRTNLVSNTPDNVQNYKNMRGAVGIKVK